MKGAHSAKGKYMRVKRKCVWRDIEDYGRVNKRHKSEGGKPKVKEKNGTDRAKGEKCMTREINCERENKELRE